METSLEYKLMIKGKEAKIGSVLWKKFVNGKEITYSKHKVRKIKITDKCKIIYFLRDGALPEYEYSVDFNHDKEAVKHSFFWEKPIVYQLPDTEGNLSEVKIGQKVWIHHKQNNSVEEYVIYSFDGNYIEVNSLEGISSAIISNGEGLTFAGRKVTTNKPKRDFSPYFDWNQAPNGYDYGAVDRDGYAYWFKGKPHVNKIYNNWIRDNYIKHAGFRQNLINPKTYCVDDWKDSLVERPIEAMFEVVDD